MPVQALHEHAAIRVAKLRRHVVLGVQVQVSGGRTSLTQNAIHKAALLVNAIEKVDAARPGTAAATLREQESWPAYRLPHDSPVASALLHAAREHHDPSTDLAVCGPSNIGNVFAAHGIPATCGFGASYRNVHAPNEAVELRTLASAYKVYRRAIEHLLIPTDQ